MTIFHVQFGVDPEFRAAISTESTLVPRVRLSTRGNAWHSKKFTAMTPFIQAAIDAVHEPRKFLKVVWWKNVLSVGAAYKEHKHSGLWSFVYHLTDGSPLYFRAPDGIETAWPAVEGQIIVFPSRMPHRTDKISSGQRISIAGNLFYEKEDAS